MAQTLFEFYQQQGKRLPSVQERAPLYSQYGITDAPGSAAANIKLLAALQGGQTSAQVPQGTAQAPQGPGGLFGQYQQRLAPITQQSESLLKEYLALSAQAPTFQQKLLDAIKQAGQYPSQATFREDLAKNPNLTPMAIEGLVSRRGQSTRGTIQDIINRATGGFEADIESRRGAADLARQQRENLLEEYGFEYGAQQDILDRRQTGRGTVGERARSSAMKQAETDASKGATSEQLARAYGSVLEPWEILQIYNDKGVYGPIEDLTSQFYQWLPGYEGGSGGDQETVDAWVSAIQNDQATISNVPSEIRNEVAKRLGISGEGGGGESPGFFARLLGTGGN